MTVTLVDDKGRRATVEGDWTAQMLGADFGGAGQIMVWLKPGADGWLEPVGNQAALDAAKSARAAIEQGD